MGAANFLSVSNQSLHWITDVAARFQGKRIQNQLSSPFKLCQKVLYFSPRNLNIVKRVRRPEGILLDFSPSCSDLPGFYFDAEKNRYFPIKGPVPGTSRTTSAASSSAQKSLRKPSQIKLYDHRMVRKAAVQSYEGNVNTHLNIQFIIDPSERFIMSGGEDSYLCIWSIKSGEMLFKKSFMESIPVVGCGTGGGHDRMGRDGHYRENHGSTAWVGPRKGYIVYNMNDGMEKGGQDGLFTRETMAG